MPPRCRVSGDTHTDLPDTEARAATTVHPCSTFVSLSPLTSSLSIYSQVLSLKDRAALIHLNMSLI